MHIANASAPCEYRYVKNGDKEVSRSIIQGAFIVIMQRRGDKYCCFSWFVSQKQHKKVVHSYRVFA